ncbi:hypothetical protein GWC77_26965 [Paraburkholderia sp. NMBU_R16]|uniref:hypothetical protein n=1 Tax=Paraburkholderia sp. NMBU_R16 TaxID=2698676 RepID=UPI00156635C7|nr:hypothetical protein [Paraburkholderia sp. NMBU_R16]NRO99517.1 hypothetical protein [Paraburkholderia sp. NMBU_R16]
MISSWPAGNVGDSDQSAGIADAVRRKLERSEIAGADDISSERLEIASTPTATKAEQLTAACKARLTKLRNGEYERLVFILSGSGENLVSALGSMPAENGSITVFSGHQLSNDIERANDLPSITALPRTSVTPEEINALSRKTTLVLTSGVAHQLSEENIAKAVVEYDQASGKALPSPIDSDTVFVILGGDAPDKESQRYFSESDAQGLARRIATMEFNGRQACRFIVTNGPRTGKHDRTGEEYNPNPHRNGKVDRVTQAFVEKLKQVEGADVHLFDFQFGSPSAYLPLVDAFMRAGRNRGRIHVPGESTSMVSQLIRDLQLPKVVIDENQAMNASHYSDVEHVLEEFGADMLKIDGTLQKGTPMAPGNRGFSAADQIADAVVSQIVRADIPVVRTGSQSAAR